MESRPHHGCLTPKGAIYLWLGDAHRPAVPAGLLIWLGQTERRFQQLAFPSVARLLSRSAWPLPMVKLLRQRAQLTRWAGSPGRTWTARSLHHQG
jgi:hypothetical protein